MEFKKFVHRNVREDGIIKNGGAVETKGSVRMSTGEGCNIEGCNCSSGNWLMICMPRTDDRIVEGIHVRFDNSKQMRTFLIDHQI